MSETIPEDVLAAARQAYGVIEAFGWNVSWYSQNAIPDDAWPIDIIARAILSERDRATAAERERTEALLADPVAVNINILAGKIKLPRNYIEVPAGKVAMFCEVDQVGDFSIAAIRNPMEGRG